MIAIKALDLPSGAIIPLPWDKTKKYVKIF